MLRPLNNANTFIGAIFFLCAIGVAHADQSRLFFHDSLNELEMTYAGKPFLLSVWSMECPPCFKELKLLGKLREEYPKFNVILISADSPDLIDEAERFLVQFNLSAVNSWIYGSNRSDQLRYAIDPRWYGEMPRSYFYNKDCARTSVSGLLSEDVLKRWIVATSDAKF